MFRRWWSDTVAAQWVTGTSRLDIYKIFPRSAGSPCAYCLFCRDALITCAVNTGTALIAGVLVFSILGYMANLQVRSLRGFDYRL